MLSITYLLYIRLMIVAGFSLQSIKRTRHFLSTTTVSYIFKPRLINNYNAATTHHSSLLLSSLQSNCYKRKSFVVPTVLFSTFSNNNEEATDITNPFPPINGDSNDGETNDYSVDTTTNQNIEANETNSAPKLTEQQQEAKASTSILSTASNHIKINTELDGIDSSQVSYPFVKMFRGSASYIANHRNTVIVYHLPGEFVESEDFPELMDDIALTWILGMRIVIVVGCRHQIDIKLDQVDERLGPDFSHHNLLRVTDDQTLRIVKEEAGYTRFEVERQLARSFRALAVVDNAELHGGNVISGNFYAAQPFGIINGVDYKYTGIMRRVEVEKIRKVHEANDIVVLTTLGFSPSGELFNVNSESLAAGVAGALKANKVIYFSLSPVRFTNVRKDKPILNMRLSEAKNLLELHGVKIHKRGYASIDTMIYNPKEVREALLKVGWCAAALENGVQRGHIITPANGSLLQELYTRDGAGTLISRDLYEGIRRATVNDVARIYDIIHPLVQQGVLIERPKDVLEKEIMSYYVYTKDNFILACGQLKRFEGGFAEIGCLVVTKEYRSKGRGDAMLGFLERLCVQSGAPTVFVLSTQTMDWFCERGFKEVGVESLPLSRRLVYNHTRKSKIYMKNIDDRWLDAEELIWDQSD